MSRVRESESARQRTIAGTVTLEGKGLHTGEAVRTTLLPGDEDSGIIFRRLDVDGQPEIPGLVGQVTGVEWETVLGSGDATVRTVEHLLAAIAAAPIDNIRIDMEGPEPPAFDGSSARWCEVLDDLGVDEQQANAHWLTVDSPFFLNTGDSRHAVVPHPGFRVSAEIDFENPAIGRQFTSLDVDRRTFRDEVAAARTFGLERWKEPLQSRGLALGADTENTIVLTDEGLAPNEELRYPDEFVRHKVIDVIGDLALVGARLRCHVVTERPSHRGNIEVARRLRKLLEVETAGGMKFDIQEILAHIPHRYPFLLVDRILEYEAGERIVGLKNVTINEPFFAGHFPDHPIMPGVLIVEAMAQVGGLLLMNEFDEPRDKVVYFMSLDDVKFRRPVTPGDQLMFDVELVQIRGRVCKMRGVARVDGKIAAEAMMMAQVVDR